MAHSHSRGQVLIEAILLMFAITGIILATYNFANLSPQLFRGYQLSREAP
jgi:hypothetical protein